VITLSIYSTLDAANVKRKTDQSTSLGNDYRDYGRNPNSNYSLVKQGCLSNSHTHFHLILSRTLKARRQKKKNSTVAAQTNLGKLSRDTSGKGGQVHTGRSVLVQGRGGQKYGKGANGDFFFNKKISCLVIEAVGLNQAR
jgi:hypothetical protein